MAGLSSPGIGSGLDINGLVSKLMAVEQKPLTDLTTKEADYQAKLTAYGTLKGAMSAFQTAAQGLSSPTKFNTMAAAAADTTILTGSASSAAKVGTYSIEVTNLAQSHKLTSSAATPFADTATNIGTGTLTIDFGTYTAGTPGSFALNANKTPMSITIDSTNSSLAGIRDAINNANGGASASIINDGAGYRLVIKSNDSGVENSLRIRVDEGVGGTNTDMNGLSQLAYDPTASAGAGKNLTESVAALSALLKVDGVSITKSSNTISDAIPGVTLNLLKATALNTPTTLTVSRDTAGVKTAVQGFVKAYNDLDSTIKSLGGYDAKTQKGGVLLGDAALRSVQSQMRSILSKQLAYAGGGLSSMSDIGISFQKDGTLALNSTKLDAALADSSKNVGSLFATQGIPTDSLITFAGSSSYTQAGNYGVNITQVATHGTATGTNAITGSTTITSGVNDTLTMNVDGTTTTITLGQGTYSPTELVAELQSRINSDSGFKTLGNQVTVSQNGGNNLVITSSRYGAASVVAVSGGTAASTLFGSTLGVTGVDVAGEIGGIAATGYGQTLTASGDATGLKLLVSGGVTGARGTVAFSFGIADQLDKAITSMLASDGTLDSRTKGIGSSISDIAKQRTALNLRLASVEKRYRAQFNALDSLVASMQQTSSYLTQQLANLPNSKSTN